MSALAATLVLTAGACSSESKGSASPESAGRQPSAAPTAPGIEYDTTTESAKPTITPDAIARYGDTDVAAADAFVARTVDDYGYNDTLILSDEGENEQQVLDVANDMTPGAAKDWTTAVHRYIDGNETQKQKAAGTVFSYSFYSPHAETAGPDAATLDGKVVTTPPSGPGAVNKEITSFQTSLDGRGRLQVHARTGADLRIDLGGRPKLWPVTRDITYYLVQTDSGWKIDGWHSTLDTGSPRPDR